MALRSTNGRSACAFEYQSGQGGTHPMLRGREPEPSEPLKNNTNFTRNGFYATSHCHTNPRRICCGPSRLRSTGDTQPKPCSGDHARQETSKKVGAGERSHNDSESCRPSGSVTCPKENC